MKRRSTLSPVAAAFLAAGVVTISTSAALAQGDGDRQGRRDGNWSGRNWNDANRGGRSWNDANRGRRNWNGRDWRGNGDWRGRGGTIPVPGFAGGRDWDRFDWCERQMEHWRDMNERANRFGRGQMLGGGWGQGGFVPGNGFLPPAHLPPPGMRAVNGFLPPGHLSPPGMRWANGFGWGGHPGLGPDGLGPPGLRGAGFVPPGLRIAPPFNRGVGNGFLGGLLGGNQFFPIGFPGLW